MKALQLDGEQRLRIIWILSQQTGVLSQIRMWGKIIDRLELTPEEELAMEVTRKDGATGWNQKKIAVVRETNMEDEEYRTLKGVLKTYNGFTTLDQRWLGTLMEEL